MTAFIIVMEMVDGYSLVLSLMALQLQRLPPEAGTHQRP